MSVERCSYLCPEPTFDAKVLAGEGRTLHMPRHGDMVQTAAGSLNCEFGECLNVNAVPECVLGEWVLDDLSIMVI